MRRRPSGLRQKPWNKPDKTDMFWTNQNINAMRDAGVVTIPGGTNQAAVVTLITGESVAADPNQALVGLRGLDHCKLHRFDGYLWAWLDANRWAGDVAAATKARDMCMLTYVWMMIKDVADVMTLNALAPTSPAASYDPHPTADLANILMRDDVIKWGTIPVFGKIPETVTAWEQNATTTTVNRIITVNAGSYNHDRVACIPFPRLPKAGLNLGKGKGLVCMAACWPGPDGNGPGIDDDITIPDVQVYGQYRLRCSR